MSRQKTNAELMKEWRRIAGYNTERAGEELDMSPRAIEDIEQGRRRDGDALTRIALEALIHDAAHEAECRDAAHAAVKEKSSKPRK